MQRRTDRNELFVGVSIADGGLLLESALPQLACGIPGT